LRYIRKCEIEPVEVNISQKISGATLLELLSTTEVVEVDRL
jgi:hypothetical protein